MTEMHKLHSHKQKYTQLVMSDGCLMGQREVEVAFEGWVVVQGFHISHERNVILTTIHTYLCTVV